MITILVTEYIDDHYHSNWITSVNTSNFSDFTEATLKNMGK